MIRPVMPSDIKELVDLSEAMHRDGKYSHISFNRKKVNSLFLHGMKNMIMVGFVDEKNDEIVGAVIGFVDSFFFSDQLLLAGYGLYVVPEYRKSKSASKLLKAFRQAGEDIGVEEVSIDSSNMQEYEALDPLYAKSGFEKFGTIYKVRFHDRKSIAA